MPNTHNSIQFFCMLPYIYGRNSYPLVIWNSNDVIDIFSDNLKLDTNSGDLIYRKHDVVNML